MSAEQRPAGLRGTLEQRFLKLLRTVARLPPWVLPVLAGVLLIVGLVLPRWLGVLCLLVVGAALGGLAYLSWSRLASTARLLVVGVLGLYAGAVLARTISGG